MVHKLLNYILVKNAGIGDRGQGLSEYGLLLGLITLMVLAALTMMGDSTQLFFTKSAEELNRINQVISQ